MNQYDRLYSRFSGAALIVAPLLIFCATLIKATGFGSETGRWYDSWIESIVLYLGLCFMIFAIVALGRIVGHRQPKLGLTSAIFGVIGIGAALFPTAVRYIGANALAAGISTEQLDFLFGGTDVAAPAQSHAIGMFIMFFFLSFILLAIGLWRIKEVPRTSPIFLVAGVVLFMVAQSPFEVIVVAYIGSTVAWLLAMAPIGIRLLRNDEEEIATGLSADPTAA